MTKLLFIFNTKKTQYSSSSSHARHQSTIWLEHCNGLQTARGKYGKPNRCTTI